MDRLSSLPPMTSFRQSGMHHGQSSPYLHSSVSPPLNGSDPMGMMFTLKTLNFILYNFENIRVVLDAVLLALLSDGLRSLALTSSEK